MYGCELLNVGSSNASRSREKEWSRTEYSKVRNDRTRTVRLCSTPNLLLYRERMKGEEAEERRKATTRGAGGGARKRVRLSGSTL